MENKYCNDCKYFYGDSAVDILRNFARKDKFDLYTYEDTSAECGMGKCSSPEKIATSCTASMLNPCYYTFYFTLACKYFEEGIHKVYGITSQEISELPSYAFSLRLWMRCVNSFMNSKGIPYYIPDTINYVQVNNKSNTEKNNSSY